MKKIILDENLPHRLVRLIPGHEVVTVQFQGWGGIQNGELIRLIDGNFDVFITADKNLKYQQNLKSRSIAILQLPFNDFASIEPLLARIRQGIDAIQPGGYLEIPR